MTDETNHADEPITDAHVEGFLRGQERVVASLDEKILAKQTRILQLQSDVDRLEKIRAGYKLGMAKIRGDV